MCLENISGLKVEKRNIYCYKIVRKVVNTDIINCKAILNTNKKFYGDIIEDDDIVYFIETDSQSKIPLLRLYELSKEFMLINPTSKLNCITFINADNEEILYYKESVFLTPYKHFRIEIGKTYESELKVDSYFNEISYGLHSYKNKEDAISSLGFQEILVKCMIPKDANYYSGTFGKDKAYASDKLTYIEKLCV